VKLNLNSSYFLVPTSWISKWRNYINPNVKNSDTPETLNVAINSLLCEKVHCFFIFALVTFCILLCGINEFCLYQFSVLVVFG
jgi:hypothetical protein